MAQRLPSTGARGCDTSEMKVIHRLFRQLFGDARRLTSEVADGDRGRAEIVGEFVLEIAGGLHSHHRTEDLLLWDELEERTPACSGSVALMRSQHAEIGERLDAVEAAVPVWMSSGSAAHRDAVLTTIDATVAPLLEHLGDEEQIILPAAATAFTQQEWDALGEHARAEIPRDRMFIQLGMILNSMDAEERRQWFRKNLPLPARWLYQLIGRRQYETSRRRIYGVTAP